MTTTISAVDTERKIEHGVLIDLTLDATTYYISNCYKEIVHNGNTYQALAGFLTVGEIQNNISNANDELQIGLSAIPPTYIAAVLGQPIKGGEVNIYRVFFDYNTQEVITGEVYKRFAGVISNYNVQEDIETLNQDVGVTHTITITASSVMGVLENKVSGRRTNRQDYQIVYAEIGNSATDPSMDRVDALFNQSFDFGKPYTGKAASSVDGPGGGDFGGGGGEGGGDSGGDGGN
jgi:hypothetical protein